jgi:hypothetical protein
VATQSVGWQQGSLLQVGMEEVKASWAASGDVAATSTQRHGPECVCGLGTCSVPEETACFASESL